MLSHLAVILVGAGTLGLYLYFAAVAQLLESVGHRVLDNVRLMPLTLVSADLDALADNTDATAKTRVEQQLRRLMDVSGDWASATLVDVRGGQPRRLAGLGNEPAEGLSPEERDLWRSGAQRGVLGNVGEAARERTELSAVVNFGSGELRYVGVLRLDAASLQASLRFLRLSGLLAFLFGILLALVTSRLMAERMQRRIEALGQRCHALASGQEMPRGLPAIGDEFDRVIEEFDLVAQRLRQTAAERESALHALTESNARLESRVAERTREIEAASGQLKAEIENRLQVEALLAEAALTDPLTSLLNRRAMIEMLAQASSDSRGQGGFCMLLADIDHFKRINDNYGHNVGDKALVAVAQQLDALQGDSRHAARWGGEEFFLVLPGTALTDACRRAEELRSRVEKMTVPAAPGLRVTISVGVAELQSGEPLEDCLRRCDQALYRAKDAGRNTVVAARGNLFATMS
ncbi:GGDEF domain-containing protein [Tahibacter amnicola]|uniref:diguanylate cyclase n=1 Tax=Tahibacter amnicola TaxID=2976241 RepID=A0ABY6BCQ8_9GAMM|nr:diguanylate cyclase [Tahibacter amnicola]UXI67592.1 diguanylate cyclase [Tahibacter amnicola]